MDPLSITASSVALAHVIHVSLKAAYSFRHAKPELIALYNEISDLLIVLRELETVLEQRALAQGVLPPSANLALLIISIKRKLEELSTQVARWNPPSSTYPVDNNVTGIRRLGIAHHAKKYKEEFKNLRERLSSVLSVTGASTNSRIEIDLKQILLLAEGLNERNEDIRNFLQSRASNSVPASITQTPEIDEPPTESPQATSGPEDGLLNGSLEETEFDVGTTRAFHHNGRILFDSKQLTAISAVGIRSAHFPRTACKPWCSCICHSKTRLQTPKFLQKFLGNLFIGYSGLPTLTKPCNEQGCLLRAQPMSNITYFFPLWFLDRMISLTMTTTPMAGPVISLKMQRTVPGNADIFTYAKFGNVEKIHSLFENGLASPHDVHYESGVTALHIAISHQRINVCKYLLDMNADPFLEDRVRWTAADNAWDKILAGSFPPASERALRLMFSETECIERRDFTTLHKTVLGLISGDLEQQLSASTADLNTIDSNGRTAVSLAAERGDVIALSTILRYNPDVNISCSSSSSPLHFAACARNSSCIQPLLDAGAVVDSLTNWEQTPLIYTAAYVKSAIHAETLLDAGAHMDWRDRDGITALGWTAIANNVPVAEVLIRRGADINNVDRGGDTFVTLCVTNNHVQLLRLLSGRTMVQNSMPSTKSLLLAVAQHATPETMRILSYLSFEGVETDVLHSDGMTWTEILEMRAGYDENMRQSANTLLRSIRDVTTPFQGTDDYTNQSNEETFEDALEHQ